MENFHFCAVTKARFLIEVSNNNQWKESNLFSKSVACRGFFTFKFDFSFRKNLIWKTGVKFFLVH